jgi:hypothetical protein
VGFTAAPEDIDEAYVRRAAALMGIELTQAQIPGVIANFQRTAQIAASVNDFVLDPVADERGPVWRL